MKLSKALMVLSTVALLAACGPTNPSDTTSTPTPSISGDVTSDTNSNTSTSETPVEEKYTVKVINDSEAVTLASDKAKAAKGETVTITATINNNNYKVSKVKVDNEECKKVNDTTYAFVMPDHPVKVTCEIMALNGDVYLQGDITAVFEQEGNLYVARNVKVNRNSNFNFIVKGKDGKAQQLGITSFDRTKTFANITFSYSNDYDLTIEGGATYDFYYDVNNGSRPCYVKRVSIDTLPSTAEGVYALFDGTVRSASAVNPENLISTTYVNSAAQERFVWNAYSDNTSLGEVFDLVDDTKPSAVVYAGIKDDKLTVVDNYAAAANKAHKDNYNLVKDNKKFSGEYKISALDQNSKETDPDEFDYRHNFVNGNIANLLVRSNPFDMQTFESDIMYGYRVGYSVEDGVTQANVTVASNFNDDDTFTVNLETSRTYDSTQDRNSQGSVNQTHYEFRITLTFTKAGALLTGNYIEKRYNNVEYNFDTNAWVQGDTAFNWENNGKVANKITIKNTYGEPTANTKKFDTSKYIISEIKNVVINNPDVGGEENNKLNLGDVANEYLTFEYAPLTALNAEQYRIINTSDDAIVKNNDGKFVAKDNGEATLTIGINNGFGVTGDCKVKIGATYLLRSIYIEARGNKYPGVVTSDSGNVYTGGINKFGIDAKESSHNKSVPLPKDISGEWIGESFGLTVSFDLEEKVLLIDATNVNVTKTETVKLQINTAIYDKSWCKEPKVFTFKVMPGLHFEELLGTWESEASGNVGASIAFTNEKLPETDPAYKASRPYKGLIICSEGKFTFTFGFNASTNVIEAALADPAYELSTLEFEYNSETHELKASLALVFFKDGGFKTVEVFGYSIGDGYYEGDIFTKKA